MRRIVVGMTATTVVVAAGFTGFQGVGAVGAATSSTRAATTSKIYFGVDGHDSIAARRYATGEHIYGRLMGSVPSGRMITMSTSGQSWNSVANAGPGSTIYTNLVRWITTLKARQGLTFLAFAHEPEATKAAKLGNAAGFVKAFQHFANIVHQEGATNVKTVWQMTGNAFRVKPSDPRYASRWYPGDPYVDYVGEDSANWDGCDGRGGYQELSAMLAAPLAWSAQHGKKVILGEFESRSGSWRPAWINAAHAFLASHTAQIEGAYYFDHPSACGFLLTNGPDLAAFGAITNDTSHFTT